MSRAATGPPGLTFRIALRAFPPRFRQQHGRDLVEMYRDSAAAGRPRGHFATLWDLLRNGLATRLDELRGGALPPTPERPGKRSLGLGSLAQDIRYGVRMLGKSPAFTAVAVISLAVGIGANTAVFGFIDAALLRPLAVQDPHELVVLGWRSPAGTEMPDVSTWGWYLRDDDGNGLSSSYSQAAYEVFRDRSDALSTVFAFAAISRVNVNFAGESALAGGQAVAGNYYSSLGVEPALGRLLVAADDRADAEAVVVLSHAYWQGRFGADEDVVGAVVRINNEPFTVVGVAAPTFRGTLQAGDNPEITVPLAQHARVSTSDRDMNQPQYWWLHVMGRLSPGVTLQAAGEQLNALFHQSVESDLFPGGVPVQYTLPDVDLRPGFQGMTEQRGLLKTPLRIMGGVVGLVLLIACFNVANLLMARASARQREIAVRLSIGASRWRVVRQLLAESLVLSACAGAAGIGLAAWGREALVGALSIQDLYVEGVRTDARVLGFGITVSLLTGVVFGLVPAFRSSRPDLTPALKDTPAATGGRRGGSWGLRTLLVSQVAMSVVLLVVAGLFVRTLGNLEKEATGFDPRGVALMRFTPGLSGYEGPRRVALQDELQRRVKAMPGVRAATVTTHSPVSGHLSMTTLKLSGYEPAEDERMNVFYNMVAPEFFDTFDVPVLAGRTIAAEDRDGTSMVAVVNRAFAERYFPGESPIGHRLGLGREGDPGEYEIVGVAENVKYQRLHDEQFAVAHVALAQHDADTDTLTLAARTAGDASEAVATMRSIMRDIDPDIPVFDARTLSAQQAATLELERFFARMSMTLGFLALGLACIGLYGVLSYSVARRTREIGVRMALGARAGDVVRLVMGELRAVLLGVLVGVGLALAVTRFLDSLLYGLSARDPLTYAVAVGVLLTVAAIAAYVPGRRASSVDPIVALRFD